MTQSPRQATPRNWSVVAGLVATALCLASCRPPAKPLPPATQLAPKPYLEGWEQPAAALLLSGEQLGYLEPCGCSLTQSGGLARRGHLERLLREKGWPVAGLDVGGSLKRTRRQDQARFEAIASGLKQLNYQALAAGAAELRLQPDYLLSQFAEGEGVTLGGLLVSCNVVFFDQPDLGVPKPWRVFSVGDVKVGVTAVLGQSHAAEVAPEGVQTNITVRKPAEALAAVLPAIAAEKPDLLMLLSHGSTQEAAELAQQFPQFQAILTAGGPEEADPRPTTVGDTLVLQVGHKGKHVGVLGYYPQATPRLRWELIDLDNARFQSDERMEQLMRTYQQHVHDLDFVHGEDLVIPHPSGRKFIGAEDCGACHKKAYNKWKGTKHAQAFASLERGRKGQEKNWVSRIYDPDCLCCHTTGWNPQEVLRYDSGYVDAETTARLQGQQCENCHGPGSAHSELERQYRKDVKSVDQEALFAARRELKLNYKTAEKDLCIKCHDYENSPEFTVKGFKHYWDQINHPGKD